MGVSKNRGFPPKASHFLKSFPFFSLSILGSFPLFSPNIWVITPKNEGFGFPWIYVYAAVHSLQTDPLVVRFQDVRIPARNTNWAAFYLSSKACLSRRTFLGPLGSSLVVGDMWGSWIFREFEANCKHKNSIWITKDTENSKPPKTFLSLELICFDAWRLWKALDFAGVEFTGATLRAWIFQIPPTAHNSPKQIVPLVLIGALLSMPCWRWVVQSGQITQNYVSKMEGRHPYRHPRKLSGSSLKRMSDLEIHLKDSSRVFNLFNQHFGEIV